MPIYVGTAGWSYRDWEGRVYPKSPPRGFDRLLWMAELFDLIEINVSFYRVPSPRTSSSWVERLRDHGPLLFSAKVPRALTHERQEISAELVRRFSEFCHPLEDADRLGATLAQFPWSFRATVENLEHLLRIRDALGPGPVVVELRHASWLGRDWMDTLDRERIDLASIDQPVIGASIGPELRPRTHTYLRLHGRNTRTWFDSAAGRDARYDYEYQIEELMPWVQGLLRLPAQTEAAFVVTNNHFEGQAVINGLELKAMLGAADVVIPEPLLRVNPRLPDRLTRWGAKTRVLESTDTRVSRERRGKVPRQPDLFDDD